MEKTHYDTLKVSLDAPIEVIRAAYRALSQKHHPDRRPDDPAAAAAMGLLNQAYEILSDPERRRAYDASILEVRTHSRHVGAPGAAVARHVRVDSGPETRSADGPMVRRGSRWRQYGLLFAGAALVLAGLAVVLLPARGPQIDAWVSATPSPEEREAYIRRLAREVMLPRSGATADSAAAADAPGNAPSSSNDLPTSATGVAMPAEPAKTPLDHAAPGLDDVAQPALGPGEEPLLLPEPPSAAASTEAEAAPEPPSAAHEGGQAASELQSGAAEDGAHLR